MKNAFLADSRSLRLGVFVLTVSFCLVTAQAQTPVPSPSPAPTPITKTGSILVNSPSTVGRISKWVTSSSNGIGTIGDSGIIESSIGTIGIGTNPFKDFRVAVVSNTTNGLYVSNEQTVNAGVAISVAAGAGMGILVHSNQEMGVWAISSNVAVRGDSSFGQGVFGVTNGPGVAGVHGVGSGPTSNGVYGASNTGTGVFGFSPFGRAIYGQSSNGFAGYFEGNVGVTNNLSTGHLFLNSGATLTFGDGTVQVTAAKLSGVSAGTGLSGGGNVGNVTLGIAAGGVNATHIATGQVVKSVNGLFDNVTLAPGDNVTITPSGNTLTISASASGQAVPKINPLQLATLRWYDMNEAQPNFSVGTEPLGLAFDGENVWVVNFTCAGCTGTVSKLRRSDGSILGTFNVGSAPVYATFDGSNIWVGNRDSNDVTKLRVSDGATLGTFPTGGNEPQWNAFDGSNLWIANGSSSSVTKMRTSDGSIVATYPTGTAPAGIAFDGTNVWIANAGSSSVTKLRASDGANLGTFGVGSQPVQLAFDGSNIWVSNLSSNTVSKLRASDGATLGTFNVNSPHGIAFDGTYIWVVSRFGNKVTKLRASDGVIVKDSVVGNNPWGIAFDGINMWISVWGQSFVTKR